MSYNSTEWVEANKSKPQPYELVEMIDKKGKTYRGWWTGMHWDGLRVEYEPEIIKWRKYSIRDYTYGHID